MSSFKRFETIIHKFKKNLHTRQEPIVDTFDEIVLCGCCDGRGYYTFKDGDKYGCEHCDSTGRLQLRVTVERIRHF